MLETCSTAEQTATEEKFDELVHSTN